MGKSITFTLTLPSLPELPALPDDPWVWAEALGWLVLVLLLLRVLSQLSAIYALLRPHAAKPPALLEMPALLLRKARLVLYGACFLVLSKDKVTSKQLKKAPDAAHATGPVEKKVRLVFIRHGESMWNYAFNRGFKPSFLWRWLETTLYELYLLPLEDSAYAAQLVGAQFGAQFGDAILRNNLPQFSCAILGRPARHARRYLDSPLSSLGLEQCAELKDFFAAPCVDDGAKADYDEIVSGAADGRLLVVASPLRRAVATVAIGLADRLKRTQEPILLHSSCQEISRNFDTMAIAPPRRAPPLHGAAELESKLNIDGSEHRGNKSLAFTGIKRCAPRRRRRTARPPPPPACSPARRPLTPSLPLPPRLMHFAQWALERPEQTIVVGGHSLWFKNFFQLYLPKDVDHPAKKRKIVNCGAVAFDLQLRRGAGGAPAYRIDPDSIRVVYGGFQP